MKYPKLSLTLGVGLTTALPLTQLSAQGVPEDLYAYEGFAYEAANPIADIGDLDGGFGFSGDWSWNGTNSGTGGYISDDAGLTYTDAEGNVLVTTGAAINVVGSTDLNAQAFRNLANAEAITEDTYYVSFLLVRHGPTDEDVWGSDPAWTADDANPRSRNVHFSLLSSGTDGAMGGDQARVGSPSNQPVDAWTFQSESITEQFTTADYPDEDLEPFSNNREFVVIRVDPGAGTDGTDYLSLYFDPLLSAEPAAPVWEGDLTDGDAFNIDFGAIGLLAGNGSSLRAPGVGAFDEIRVGASWEAVAQYGADSDGDGISNAIDTDNDNDGLLDEEEESLGTDPFNADSDGDGVSDADEVDDGTDPLGTALAYEGFDYAENAAIETLNGGSGFANGWTASNGNAGDGIAITSESMGYQDAGGRFLVTSGASAVVSGSADKNAQFFRNLEDLDTLQDGSYYVSFLLERQGPTDEEVWGQDPTWTGDPDGNTHSRNVQVALLSQNSISAFGSENAVVGGGLAGSEGDNWMFQSKSITVNFSEANYPGAGLAPFYANQKFVVVRVTPGAGTGGTDQIAVFFDPDLSSESASTPAWEGDADDGGPFDVNFGAIGMLAGSGTSFRAPGVGEYDELRVGKTWQSVTPYDVDTDADGTPDFADDDIDDDGLDNDEELEFGTNPYLADSDLDGVSDADEVDGQGDGDPTGTTLAYEGFDYDTDADLLGGSLNGGSGWDAGWTINSTNGQVGDGVIQSEDLAYTDGSGNILLTSGRHVHLSALQGKGVQFERKLASILGSDVGTYYVSFIAERTGEQDPNYLETGAPRYAPNSYARNAQIALLDDGLGDQANIGNFSSLTTDTWKLWSGNGNLDAKSDGADSGIQFSNNRSFVVVRVDVGAGPFGGNVYRFYHDPNLRLESVNSPEIEEESTDDFDGKTFDLGGIGMYLGQEGGDRAAAEMLVDEIRVGTSWKAVTPHARDTDDDGTFDDEDDDIDGDGLTNEEEARLGTDPYLADTDGDGVNDADELNGQGDRNPVGTTIAYEGFDYAVGTDLLTDAPNGGTGWNSGWTINSSNGLEGMAVVQDGGLGYEDGDGNVLTTSGNHVYVDATIEGNKNAQFQRHLAAVLDSAPGTYYISFIGERQGEKDPILEGETTSTYFPNEYGRNAQLAFLDDGFGEAGGVGNYSNVLTDTWKMWSGNSELDAAGEGADSGVQFSNNQQFAVVRVDVEAGDHGGHVLSLYLDPALASEGRNEAVVMGEAADDVTDGLDWALGGIGLYIGNSNDKRAAAEMAFDEIRVGKTWQSVTPYDRDTDEDGIYDSADDDIDGDGLKNAWESYYGTNPHLADTDGDGVNDADEIAAGTDPIGTPIAYEGFDYAAGTDLLVPANGANGGTGWNAGWTINSSNGLEGMAVVQDSGLGYEDADGNNLLVTGNHVYVDATIEGNKNAQFQRHLAAVLGSEPGTYYISFIGERQGEKDPVLEGETSTYFPNEYGRNAQLAFLDEGFGEAGGVGNYSNVLTDTWKLWSGNSELNGRGEGADSGVQFSYNQQFVVVRVDVQGGEHGGNFLSLYLDPELNGEGSNVPVVMGEAADDITDGLDWALGGIGLYIGNSNTQRAAAEMAFDEIRVGRTWQAVAPIDHDTDDDGTLDSLDSDIDGDGVNNDADAFPYDASESVDTDGDGIGDNADTDDDGDGASDALEASLGSDPLDAGAFPSTQSLDLESTPGMFYNGDFEYLTVTYSTNDMSNAPAELAFRVHYNSSLVVLDFDADDAFAAGTTVTLDNDDSEDLDGSTLTDKYIQVTISGSGGAAWLDSSATLPVEIGEVEVNSLGADLSVPENTYTQLRFSAVEQPEGFFFEAEPEYVRLLLWYYDEAYGWIYPYEASENLVYSAEFASWLWVVDATGDNDAFAYNYSEAAWMYLHFEYGGWFYHYGINQWDLIVPTP